MTERPQNIRAADILQRSYAPGNSAGKHPENQIANRVYRGSHRADTLHDVDDPAPAARRSSRVGRHHADQPDDHARNR